MCEDKETFNPLRHLIGNIRCGAIDCYCGNEERLKKEIMDDLIEIDYEIEYKGNDDSALIDEIISTMFSKQIISSFEPDIINIQKRESQDNNRLSKTITIGIPVKLIDPSVGGIANIFQFFGGDLFASKNFTKLRTSNIEFPKSLLHSYRGPKFGINGIRKKLNIKHRPIISCLVYPKFGLSPNQYANMAKDLLENGADMVADDQYFVSNSVCPIYEKADAVFSMLKEVIKKNGDKLYSINITSGSNLIRIYDRIHECANKYGVQDNIVIAYNGITCGFTGLEILCDISDKPIQVHVGSHGVLTRYSNFSISMHIFWKLFRLLGADLVNAGHVAAANVWYTEKSEVIYNNYKALRREWEKIEPSFPVAAGGINPFSIEQNMKDLGNDIVFQLGDFVFSYPHDYKKGIKCVKETLNWLEEEPGSNLINASLTKSTEYPELKEFLKNVH